MSLKIYNSLSRRLESFVPLTPPHVRMYVCGMTVYDLCHLGHARSMVAFDIVQRWLKASGWDVTYVRNVTDIDDKIIERATSSGESITGLTQRMIQCLNEDADALGVERPTYSPCATDYVPQMLDLIECLEQKGLAYRALNGDVFYRVRQFTDYGRLSGKSLDQLRAGARVVLQADKMDPLDFVLWKASKPGEPVEARWNGPYGQGRPGWHIECSAMSCALLGESFDIHGGGMDLQFPHHENEIAQSEGATGQPLARFWMHNGFVRVGEEKMSKSLGNFLTIRDLLTKHHAQTLRFFIVRSHYRSELTYTPDQLEDAQQGLKKLYGTLHRVSVPVGSAVSVPSIDWNDPWASAFKEAMDQDFGTPKAVAVLFDLAAQVTKTASAELAHLLKQLGGVLGLLQEEPTHFLQDLSLTSVDVSTIDSLIAERAQLKAQKQFARADQIRSGLLAQGIALKDGPQGTSWERV